MKRLLLSYALLAGLPAAHAQAPAWQTALSLGGGSYSSVEAAATDAAGNVYLAGWFSNSSLVLGSITLPNAVTSGSTVGFSKDAFVAKWSPVTQDFVWAQRAGGTTDGDQATALAVWGDAVYVATSLVSAPAGLGGGPAATGHYLTKLTEAGARVWTQPVGGPAAALVAQGSSLYAAGSFAGPVSFGSTSLTSVGSNDLYLTKLIDTGAGSGYSWVQRTASAFANSLVISGNNLYLAGTYYNSTVLGGAQLTGQGAFLAKLTDAGSASSVTWVQPISHRTLGSDVGGIALATSGPKIYAAGTFSGTIALGPTLLTSLGYQDLFVAQLLDAGATANVGWVRQAGGVGSSTTSHALAVSGSNLYLAGTTGSVFGFDGSPASANAGGVLVAKLTDTGVAGKVAWVQQAPAQYTASCTTLARNGNTLYVGGMIGAGSIFGSQPFPTAGGPRAYLAALTDTDEALPTRDPSVQASLALYPNPAHDAATVRVPAGPAPATLTLFDALGRTVAVHTAPAGQDYALRLAGLAPGVYALRVRAGEALTTQKLLVE